MSELDRLRKNVFENLQEIERLNNIINDLKSSIADYQEAVGDYQEEIERKDNIISELEIFLIGTKDENINLNFTVVRVQDILDKLKELKEVNK